MRDFFTRAMPLHERLQSLAVAASERTLTMDDGLHRLTVGANGYGIPLLLVSLPAALPMPALGLSSVLGVVVVLFGLQMLTAKHTVWLPRWFLRIRLRPDWIARAARLGKYLLPRLEHIVKSRMIWMRCFPCTLLLGIAVILLGLMMMMPIPGTNTPPAIFLLILSVALIENDGLLAFLMVVMALALMLLYAEAIYLLITWLAG